MTEILSPGVNSIINTIQFNVYPKLHLHLREKLLLTYQLEQEPSCGLCFILFVKASCMTDSKVNIQGSIFIPE